MGLEFDGRRRGGRGNRICGFVCGRVCLFFGEKGVGRVLFLSYFC